MTLRHKRFLNPIFVIFISLSFAVGCSSNSKKEELVEEPTVAPEAEVKFNLGLIALEKENYAKAVEIFNSILVENPASEFDLITLYNSGAAYEGLGDCRTSGRRYRQAAQASAKRYPLVEAQSVFRLSYAYECLGFTEKVIASLMDAKRRKSFLSDEIVLAEIPARLASAYAHLGQIDMAKKYFAEAEEGIKILRRENSERNDLKDLLARTYYFMGRVQPRQDDNVEPAAFFQSLRFQQTHLIRAVEMGSSKWSRKAADTIVDAYKKMWKLMEQGRTKRAKASYQEKRSYVLAWLENALQAIAELKMLRFPGAQERFEAKRMFSQLEEEERRIKEFLAEFAVSHPLTPEAQEREGLKREGRVKSSPTPLEKEALKRNKGSKK